MNELVKLGEGSQASDIFFGQEPEKSDWAAIITAIHNGEHTVKTCLTSIADFEPVEISSTHTHTVFVLQQMLRLCLRKEKGKPLLTEKTCLYCGTNKLDDVLESCLACAEEESQFGYYGNRGATRYVKPHYDVNTGTWGILFYEAHYGSHEAIYIFWIALGWKTRREAQLAIYPLSLFEKWVDRQLNGLGDADPRYFYGLNGLMKQALPFTPTAFEQYTKERMTKRMANLAEESGFENRVEWALREYESREREQKQ